jgi:hypothetical protein
VEVWPKIESLFAREKPRVPTPVQERKRERQIRGEKGERQRERERERERETERERERTGVCSQIHTASLFHSLCLEKPKIATLLLVIHTPSFILPGRPEYLAGSRQHHRGPKRE